MPTLPLSAGAASDDEPNGRGGKFALQSTDLSGGGIVFLGDSKQNFKDRIVLLNLRNESLVGIRI